MRFLRVAASIIFLAAFSVCVAASDNAQDKDKRNRGKMAYRGFIGGMMLHTGYLSAGNVTYTMAGTGQTRDVRMAGAPFGIGGAMRFIFGNHLRVGGEGAVSTMHWGEHKSSARLSYGGVIADSFWTLKRWKIFVGALVGGGSQSNTVILEDAGNDFVMEDETMAFRKFGFCLASPFVGVEFAMTPKVNLVMKVDYMLPLTKVESDFTSGPRVFLGFMFGHTK